MKYEPMIQQQQQQISREELARAKQAVIELEHHYNSYESQLRSLQHTMKTPEDALRYSTLMLDLNKSRDNLNSHINAYNQLIQLTNFQFPTGRLSEQTKKEIYHFYHSGRYNQNQLASQYGVQQGTISKIVNDPQPN